MTDAERTALVGEAPQCTARGYTGHEHLERTGLIHMNGRVYDPVIGRFLSPDPIVADASFSQSWNAYSYALNSPLSYSDPTGLTAYCGWCDDNAYTVEWAQRILDNLRNAFHLSSYFSDEFDYTVLDWNGVIVRSQVSSPVPLQGATSVGEESGPADQPMAHLDEFERFMEFVRTQDVERPVDQDIIVERVAARWEDLPADVRDFEPEGVWGPFADDRGHHIENQRLPGGYHLTVDRQDSQVNLHFDAHDPLAGPQETYLHWDNEVRLIETGRLRVLRPRNRFPDWEGSR